MGWLRSVATYRAPAQSFGSSTRVTTPLPAAVELATRYECGFVVPFGDPRAAADAVLALARDSSLRAKMGRRGHEAARSSLGWPADAQAFVAQLERWALTPA